ncbi:TLC domain-containing protein 3A-like [Rhincodon typus]|uniref:TLC domain-containing protein 3A-like n=1 Tax=Rhincodon typus TaxID=259920 RepID=UPI00202F8299|nr:TLC domain-containing protein 3A-like [Rhincodon typus]
MWHLLALGCLFFPCLFILTRRSLQKNFPELTDVDTVNISYYRKGLGDFFLGCLFLAELSTPFVSFAKILKRFRKQNTLLYKVNGVIVLATFFLCRILVFPYMYWAYGKQYGIPAHLVPFRIPLHCTLGNAMLLAPQVYWLSLIIRKAGKTVKVE